MTIRLNKYYYHHHYHYHYHYHHALHLPFPKFPASPQFLVSALLLIVGKEVQQRQELQKGVAGTAGSKMQVYSSLACCCYNWKSETKTEVTWNTIRNSEYICAQQKCPLPSWGFPIWGFIIPVKWNIVWSTAEILSRFSSSSPQQLMYSAATFCGIRMQQLYQDI